MKRKRSIPWIHRYSRLIIGAIASTGAVLTAYLTITKLTGGEIGCAVNASAAAGSCNDVFSSPYATVFGLPLSLFGFLAYLAMIIFALSPYMINPENNRDLRNKLEHWTGLFLLIGSTAMMIFSAYLMYILFGKIQAVCYYCIGSALFSLSLFLLTVFGREWEDIGQIVFTSVIVAFITFMGTLGIYAPLNNPAIADGKIPIPPAQPSALIPGKGWEISTRSGAAEIELAKHLSANDFKMYGAYWCPHCYDQKALFGKEAFAEVEYIECAADGENAQPRACEAAGVRSYPSWAIDGQLRPGRFLLDELADLSNYEGSREFKYVLPTR
ncbi:MAG: vitamin K epoxide reductase family protein [Spirulina sp.]